MSGKPSQCQLSHICHLRCWLHDKKDDGLYVSQVVFRSQLAYYTSDYQRALFSTAPGFGGMLLRDCVGKVHQEIVTCWNFKDEEKVRCLCGVTNKQYSNNVHR